MTLQEALKKGRSELRFHEIEEYELDSRLLLEHVTGLSHGQLLLRMHDEIAPADWRRFQKAVARRAAREPLQHIMGSVDFMGLSLKCDARALIPRQETELLAERAVKLSRKREGQTALDLCTGSGCIAAAMAVLGRFESVTATDLSAEALSLAKENFALTGARVETLLGDLFLPVAGRRFDIITANPPYIARAELDGLMPEVRDHDPMMALDGGSDGLDFYRRIAAEAPRHLRPDGCVLTEIGDRQAAAVSGLFADAGFANVRVWKDYSGRDRIVTAAGGNDV